MGILCESVFVPIERRTSILKLVIIDVFIMKPKHQYHLSQQGERVYHGQSQKERDYYVNPRLSQLKYEL